MKASGWGSSRPEEEQTRARRLYPPRQFHDTPNLGLAERGEVKMRKEAWLDSLGGPRAFLAYDPDTGHLTHLPRPDNPRFKHGGQRAGTLDSYGYAQVNIGYRGTRFQYRAHRVIFRMVSGRWPRDTMVIHHINGDRADNRASNLAETSNRGNMLARFDEGPAPYFNATDKLWLVRGQAQFKSEADAVELQARINEVVRAFHEERGDYEWSPLA